MEVLRRFSVAIAGISWLYASQAVAAEATVIHAGWLLTAPDRLPAERQSIVIVDGRIREIRDGYLQRDDLSREDTLARIIDLGDAYVLPGLIDSHVHLATSPTIIESAAEHREADLALIAARHAEIALQAGFTTVVDLGSIGQQGHENAIFAVRDGIRNGLLPGPRVLAAGTPIAAPGASRSSLDREPVEKLRAYPSLCAGASDCQRAVRYQVERGSDIITFFNTGSLLSDNAKAQTMTEEEMRAIVSAAHAHGRKVIADGHHARGIAAALRAGADIIDSAHLYDAQTFADFGPKQYLQSHIHGVVQAIGDTPDNVQDGLWGWLPRSILLRFLQIKQRKFAMIAAYDAGLENLAYASDAGVYSWGENAADLLEFVRRGMSAQQALATATTNAARMLGLDTDIGTVEVGKAADIIATASNPLHDIAALLEVNFVMRAGTVYRYGDTPATAAGTTGSAP